MSGSGKVDRAKFDVMQLHARPELAAQHRMVDNASGDVKVREKNKNRKRPLCPEMTLMA